MGCGHIPAAPLLRRQPHSRILRDHLPVQEFDAGVDRLDRRRRGVGQRRHFQRRADEGFDFERAPHLDVLEHGRLMRADAFGAGDAFLNGVAEGDTEFFGGGLGFGHHLSGEASGFLEPADLFQRRVGERADRVEREIPPGLEPDLGSDVIQDTRTETTVDEGVVQQLHAFGRRAVQFADWEPVAFDVMDDAGFRHVGGGVDDAADDPVGIDVLFQNFVGVQRVQPMAVVGATEFVEIPPGNAVLDGDDHRVVMHQMTDVFRHLIEIMRLQGEDDEVLGPGVPDVVDGVGNLGHVLAAVLPNQFQAVLADGVQVDTLINDRDFFSWRAPIWRPSIHRSRRRLQYRFSCRPPIHASGPHRARV